MNSTMRHTSNLPPAGHRNPEGGPCPVHTPGLDLVRRRIEELDQELVDMIALRCRLAQVAGARKSEAGLPIVDPGQEAAVVRRGAVRARSAGVDEELVRQIFWCLIDISRQVQGNGRAADVGTKGTGSSAEAAWQTTPLAAHRTARSEP